MKTLSFPMLSIMLLVAAVALVPLMTFAATYFYVDMSGEVESVEAGNADAAMNATVATRDAHSGVAVDMGTLEEGDEVDDVPVNTGGPDGLYTYSYVTVFGTIASVEAPNATVALDLSAHNRAETSGVVRDDID